MVKGGSRLGEFDKPSQAASAKTKPVKKTRHFPKNVVLKPVQNTHYLVEGEVRT